MEWKQSHWNSWGGRNAKNTVYILACIMLQYSVVLYVILNYKVCIKLNVERTSDK